MRAIYTLRDTVGRVYRDVVCDDTNEEVAKRNLAFQVNNNPQFMFLAKDLEFMKVGEFDEHTGVINGLNPVVVCHVSDLIGA